MCFVKGFAHRQQTHARRITTDTPAGAGDAPLHCSQIAPKVLNAVGLRVAAVALVQGQGVDFGDLFNTGCISWQLLYG